MGDIKGYQVMKRRSLLVPMFTRGNVGKLIPVVRELRNLGIHCKLICSGSLVEDLSYFSNVMVPAFPELSEAQVLRYFTGDGSYWGMGLSFANAGSVLANSFSDSDLFACLVVGDRYEALAVAAVSVCNNIPVIHLEGGEKSGCLDESFRHALTKLSSAHIVSNTSARDVVLRLGEDVDKVCVSGATSMYFFAQENWIEFSDVVSLVNKIGTGVAINAEQPLVVVSIHPDNFDSDFNSNAVSAVAAALKNFDYQIVWLSPNADAGSGQIQKSIRSMVAEGSGHLKVRFLRALPINYYASLLARSSMLIGNSSSGLREAEALPINVINIGQRQNGRDHGVNTINAQLSDLENILRRVSSNKARSIVPDNLKYGTYFSAVIAAQFIASLNELIVQKDAIYR